MNDTKVETQNPTRCYQVPPSVLCGEIGYRFLQEILFESESAAASAVYDARSGYYFVEGITDKECLNIRRRHINALPGTLSLRLNETVKDTLLLREWTSERFSLLLFVNQDSVRAYRYMVL